ncbi:hypothetical protein DL96DRAFT_1603531 [Flagelloscypha sp. PMI_526]|nr:hypothetical protein DL96DRAFT_1603531 [Flagelloscypha sp. PMI_526]
MHLCPQRNDNIPKSSHFYREHLFPHSLDAFSDELILSIFTHLSFADLCRIQTTCRTWLRLSLDNELWKTLYISTFGGRTRLRGARGFSGPHEERIIRPLPARSSALIQDTTVGIDWKWMFRISWNWRTGRCHLVPEPEGTLPQVVGTHLLLSGSLTVTASSAEANPPNIYAKTPLSELTFPTRISCLALDQAPHSHNSPRLIACLSTGEISVFEIDLSQLRNPVCKMTYVPHRQQAALVLQAAYHHPLLVTLSDAFQLCIYDLSNDSIHHKQTLTSFSTYPPTSFVLSRPLASSTYKLVMAYAMPVYAFQLQVYPQTLFPTAQEVMKSLFHTGSPPIMDVPQGWVDETKLKAMREQWSRKVTSVSETQTDGRWVVLAPGADIADGEGEYLKRRPTTLQLYKLTSPGNSASIPKLTFVRSLHGQTGQVTSLALSDGRCVSLSDNGCICVWDLEGSNMGVQVSPGSVEGNASVERGRIVFDDRKILSSLGASYPVEVRRFDI